MGLRDELTLAIAEAFSGDLADAVKEFAAMHVSPGTYDPVTGSQTAENIPYSGRGVFTDYSNHEIDGSMILATDIKLIALQAEVTRAPVVGDAINGLRAQRVSEDPAGATWTVQLRA